MEHCKLQIGCLVVLFYVVFIYWRERKNYNLKQKKNLFDKMLLLGIISIILDASTSYTVNHLDTVNLLLNRMLHALFLISLDSVIFILCLYMLFITGDYPKRKYEKLAIFVPFIINIIIVIFSINTLEYRNGRII